MNLTKNKIESWLDINYTSVLELLVTLASLFFNGLKAATGNFYFICA